jgi:flagellar biogenesis protein FliO
MFGALAAILTGIIIFLIYYVVKRLTTHPNQGQFNPKVTGQEPGGTEMNKVNNSQHEL